MPRSKPASLWHFPAPSETDTIEFLSFCITPAASYDWVLIYWVVGHFSLILISNSPFFVMYPRHSHSQSPQGWVPRSFALPAITYICTHVKWLVWQKLLLICPKGGGWACDWSNYYFQKGCPFSLPPAEKVPCPHSPPARHDLAFCMLLVGSTVMFLFALLWLWMSSSTLWYARWLFLQITCLHPLPILFFRDPVILVGL